MAHSGANSGAQPGSRPARAVIRAEVGHGSAELVGDPDRPHGWTLLVDGTAQSHVDLDDPVHLEFEYIRRIGHLIDLCAPAYAPLRALHLGGGAWTLARYVAATRPGSTQTVVELDGPLAEFVGAPPSRRRAGHRGHGRRRARRARRNRPGLGRPGRARRLRGRPNARAPHLGAVRRARRAHARPRGRLRRERRRRRSRARVRGFAGGRGPRRPSAHVAVRRPARRPARPPVRQPRAGRVGGTRLPLDDLRRYTASDPFPARVLAGADLDQVHRGGPHRPDRRPLAGAAARVLGALEDAVGARLRHVRPGAPRTSPRSTTCRSCRTARRTSTARRPGQRSGDRVRSRPPRSASIGRPGVEVGVVRAGLGPVRRARAAARARRAGS